MSSNNDAMAGLNLNCPVSLDGVDDLLRVAANVKDVSRVVIDPSSFAELAERPMLESSCIQWISTLWSAAQKEAFEVSTTIQEGRLERLAVSAPGAVLTLLPFGKLRGVSRHSVATFRKQYFERQAGWPDLAVSDSAFMLCVDSYPTHGLPRQLYSAPASCEVTNWDGFRLFVDKLIRSVTEEAQLQGEIQGRANNLSTILFELFKNTHDHARVDVKGAVMADSVRGIYSRFYSVSSLASAVPSDAGKGDALSNYLLTMLTPRTRARSGQPNKRNLSGFLELTVFDTGPGMAARWLGRDISSCSAKEQYDAVIQCLTKGNSSTHTRTRGFGLWRVLQELIQVKGFIRIRTNRVHVFRQYAMLEDLHMQTHADGYQTPKEIFNDWKRQYTSSLSDYPSVKGTTISILVPVGVL